MSFAREGRTLLTTGGLEVLLWDLAAGRDARNRGLVVSTVIPQPAGKGKPVAFVVGLVANGIKDGG